MRSSLMYDENDHSFNVKMAAVVTDTDLYVETLIDFYVIFDTLENELQEYANHPCINGVVPEELMRTEAFEKDLQYFLGESWQEKIKPSKAAEAYSERIIKIASREPTLLLA